jgi:cytochrome c
VRRFTAFAIVCAIGVASPVRGQDDAVLKRGEALMARLCAGCHAIGRTGTSPHVQAPPFRLLGRRYPIESLEEALGEGIVSGHPDMPEFKFSAADVGAVVAYLKSIQER